MLTCSTTFTVDLLGLRKKLLLLVKILFQLVCCLVEECLVPIHWLKISMSCPWANVSMKNWSILLKNANYFNKCNDPVLKRNFPGQLVLYVHFHEHRNIENSTCFFRDF